MSVVAMTWIWQHSEAIGADRLMLLAIADSADDDGRNAWPSIATLAAKCRVSPNTARLTIRRLEKRDHIGVERNAGGPADRRADRRTNRYTIIMAPRPIAHEGPLVADDPSPTRGRGQSRPLASEPHDPSPVRGEPSLEPSNYKTQSVSVLADFDAIWQHYPRKTNRKGAEKAFRARVRGGVDIGQLAEATRIYAIWCERAGVEESFILHGATFYGPNDRWLDYTNEATVILRADRSRQARGGKASMADALEMAAEVEQELGL